MQNKLPNRKPLRLKHYDYSQAGYYFVTICTEEKQCLFGDVVDGVMKLNNAGEMVYKWVLELSNKYNNVKLDEFVIMPNHVHLTTIIVGADLRVSPLELCNEEGTHIGAPLPTIIQWLKTMTTNDYIRGVKNGDYPLFNKHIWQRNYYEHIIRNDKELHEIREYITNNPPKWELDKYYKE